jgi:hypothetical protein
MSIRSAKFVAALLVSVLAGASFAAVAENGTGNGTKAADNCLAKPQGAAPAGSHWYYHLDRGTKRQCWYIGEEKNKAARTAPPQDTSSPPSEAANAVPPQQNPPVSKSVADAHAEWSSPQSSVAPDAGATGAIPASDNDQRTTAPDGPQSSAVASRWPDASEANSSNNPQLAAADLAASPQANATAPPEPAASPVALTVADSSLAKPSGSTQTLLMVMASALAFAGLIGTVIFRFGRRTPAALAEIRHERPAPWDSIHLDRPQPPIFPRESAPIRRPDRADPARDPRAPDDPERRIAEMLARLARNATTA